MTDSLIEMRGVTKSFGCKTVLNELDFTLRRGTVTGLLGKNGSGKSTLLKCALGLQTPQSGSVTIFGEPVAELSAANKARLGYVPQEISLYPWMKVRQIVAYTRAFYPRWNDGLLDRLLVDWELNPGDKVSTLSPGQLQKLGIVLSLGHEPELLVLDEPVASLDPVARRQFLATLLEIALTGERTVLLSTHITSDLERVADQVVVLRGGRVVYDDELSVLKDSVKRIQIQAIAGLPQNLPQTPGVLHCESSGSTAVVSFQGFDAGTPERLAREWNAAVHVEDLNLEEIFLELHHA